MDRQSPRREDEARQMHEEELAEGSALIPGEREDEADFEGYDETQRAEVMEAEGTDPFNRPLMHDLPRDEDGEQPGKDAFPDEDPEIDSAV